ncbi:pitrilysin family protein [Rickettsia endosymbiont of Polydrusus tereticollis]|uniref:M16 family metallopeptidase n=1 Tax=Rickettsia endosymbiont of Polydrusus tereticollis TaxID=3066251 RepID=UPI003132C08E
MKETFNVSKLNNGLTILTYNMPYVNSVAINLIAKVGSRFETSEEEGMSHFLEHMAFKGTKTRNAKQIAEEFDEIGGHFNAYTGHEQTIYYSKILPENCRKALEILADIIQNSTFAEEEIAKEYQVILQEIAHSQDNPDDLIYEKFYNSVYKGQPLGKPILGTSKTLAIFNKKHFSNFIDKHYTAQNLYLSVAGNITHDEIIKIVEQLFPSLKQGTSNNFEPARYVGGYCPVIKDLEQTTLILGFEGVGYLNMQQLYQAQLLALIFGGGMSSRLFQQIREKLGLAYGVGSYNSSYCDSGVFTIYASTAHDKLELLSTELINEVKKIMESVQESEIIRAKTQLRSNIYMAQEKPAYKSEEIGKNYAIFNKYISIDEIMELIMNITAADILKIAGKIFSTVPTLGIIGPEVKNVDYYTNIADVIPAKT